MENIDTLTPGTLFSHTGAMDQELTLKGQYVESFQGYLEVRRVAQIYAWDRDKKDDRVTWSKKWMSSLENNDRNKGLKKKFQSDTIRPGSYLVSDLPVKAEKIQFVDSVRTIPPSELTLTKKGNNTGLVPREEHFYLAKGDSDQLGDARISYHGLPVPEVATYFGKWGGTDAVAHQAKVRKAVIANIINDMGILHHLVAGPRETAFATLKKELARLKMIIRIVALITCVSAGGILFSGLTRLLVFIPVVGPLLNQVAGWIGLLVGFLLGVLTMILAFLTSKPILLVGLLIILIVALVVLVKTANRTRSRIRNKVAGTLGHPPSPPEFSELEFIHLWQLAASNNVIESNEKRVLDEWTKRHAWSPEKVAELTHRAEQERTATNDQQKLETLIRFSLADGRIDRKELKTLQTAADWVGIDKKGLRSLMSQIQTA